MYAITGATGHTGRAIAQTLLSHGKKVRVIGRSADRLKPLVDKGAEAFVADAQDAGAMTRAFAGATAVYTMVPPNLAAPDLRAYHEAVGSSLAAGLAAARVRHVVNLSSVGAHLAANVGPITGLRDVERRLDQLPALHVVHLRPSFFMENHLWSIGLIKQAGINGGPLKPDLALPMIATRDIAAAAVTLLLELTFTGTSSRELLGPRELTMTEATRILGAAIGQPDLRYVQFEYAQAEQALLSMGLSKSVAAGFIEMYRGFNDGVVRPAEARSARNTTPTTLETFAAQFAAAYAG